MTLFKLPNGLTAQILRINDYNGKRERWPPQVLCYANSYVVKVNVKGYAIGLVFSENCLYQYPEDMRIRQLFLPPGTKALKEFMLNYFKPAVKVSSPLIYSGVAYEQGSVTRQALETAILMGVPPSICVLVPTINTGDQNNRGLEPFASKRVNKPPHS
jgi:hypothetical protein